MRRTEKITANREHRYTNLRIRTYTNLYITFGEHEQGTNRTQTRRLRHDRTRRLRHDRTARYREKIEHEHEGSDTIEHEHKQGEGSEMHTKAQRCTRRLGDKYEQIGDRHRRDGRQAGEGEEGKSDEMSDE